MSKTQLTVLYHTIWLRVSTNYMVILRPIVHVKQQNNKTKQQNNKTVKIRITLTTGRVLLS